MEDFINIISNFHESGLLTFFTGILTILGIYHFLLYFQQKIRSYLFYSLYLFSLLLSISRFGSGEYYEIFRKYFRDYQHFTLEISFVVYILFAYSFLEMKRHAPRWNKYVLRANFLFLGIVICIQTISFFAGGSYLRVLGYNFSLIYMPVLVVLAYYPIIKRPIPLKFYIIIGSSILFLGWLGPALVYQLYLGKEIFKVASGFFLLCVIAEALLFSLGLGHKQKLLLRENKQAKKEIQRQLERNLELQKEQAEKEKLEKIKIVYEREMAELKLSALNNQMNPHFIFNSLNAIKLYIIENDKDNAVHYLNKFSKLIRRILASARIKEVSLSKELEIIMLYVSIENIRFQNEIDFHIDIGSNLNTETIKLPSLILQPFLENSIWHGFSGVLGAKKIYMQIEKESEAHLKISISDNGIGRKKAGEIKNKKLHQREPLGINITKERLKSFSRNYRNSFSFEFEDLKTADGIPCGTRVIIKIPLI